MIGSGILLTLSVCVGLEFTHLHSTFTIDVVKINGEDVLEILADCPSNTWCGFGFNALGPQMDGADVTTFGHHDCCDGPRSPRATEWHESGRTVSYGIKRRISITDSSLGDHTIEVDAQQNLFNWTYDLREPGRMRGRVFRTFSTLDPADVTLTRRGIFYVLLAQGGGVAAL